MVLHNHRRAGETGAVHRQHALGGRIIRASALGALSCAVATGGLVLSADAAVNPRHTVFVLKNEGIVEAEGFAPGENVRMMVRRNGVVVGSVAGPAEGGAFIVNHDFCWDGFTPRILPGDVVAVRSRTGLDTVRVADIDVTQPPTITGPGTGTIQGQVNGPRVPVGQLLVELRSGAPARFRPLAPGNEDGVVGRIAYDADTGGEFTATFTGMTAQQEAQFANPDEFSVSHAPAANEMTQATQATLAPGPDCGAVAPVVDDAVTVATPRVISTRNPLAQLRVQGFATDAEAVIVRLSDRDGTRVNRRANVAGAVGLETWTTGPIPATALRGLSGRVSVVAIVDGVRASVATSMFRDVVAPRRPGASVDSGTYRRTQFVALSARAGDRIRYTVGNGTQAAPNRVRGTLYRGGQIRIARSRTLKMVAIDAAGNVSRVARRVYRIR